VLSFYFGIPCRNSMGRKMWPEVFAVTFRVGGS
jgi:hypothetical protein